MAPRGAGELLAAVSSMVVGVYADHLGRGPTKARSVVAEATVTCVLEETLTRAERTLLDAGQEAQVTAMRSSLQATMEADLRVGMARLSGREVLDVIGGTDVRADVSVQVFLLGRRLREPAASAPPQVEPGV